jgi:signal transduction histidine kinase/HAMP domain-containing protein
MFNFFHKSLRNKIFVIFTAIGLLPFVTLLIYTIFLTQTKIVNQTIVEQLDRTDVVIKLIKNHLDSLQKEVDFLSQLDLMDDLLAEDIDKRISRLLSQKANDLNLDADFFIINEKKIIIASSNKEYISKPFTETEQYGKTHIKNSYLYITSKIKPSFDETQLLGTLILKYNLENLNTYMTHNKNIQSYIFNPNENLYIGKEIPLKIDVNSNSNYLIDDNYVIVYKKLSSSLSDFYIVYTVEKNTALEFLHDFMRFMLVMGFILFLLIIYVSVKYSKEVVKPIEDLTHITQEIIKTQDYSGKLDINTQDEIATLSNSFNNMLQTTTNALQKLENENKLRLKRFTQLINVFNTIIQTKTEDECIDISMQEIKQITANENLHFHKTIKKSKAKEYTDIYVTDFEKDIKIYFGSIELDLNQLQDKNEKDFYNSIASMVALQLDRIRLIERTMSASKAKSAFISNMSHELRTPLNAIIGFAQYLVVYEELNEDQIDTISNIESSAEYLLSMINEILDIAKIESGKMEARYESVSMLELIQNSVEMLSPLVYDKELEFSFDDSKFTNQQIITDPKMLKQVIINLLSNAIKFTKDGAIQVELTEDTDNIYVHITDSGVGISAENIDKLFQDFTQLDSVMHKQHKGTGLGLSLSKKMAKILGGDVTLTSKGIGKGVTATLTILKKVADV